MALEDRNVLVIRKCSDREKYVVLSGADGELCAVAEESNPSSLAAILESRQPDWIVLDLEIPIRHGVELLRAVQTACPRAEVMTRVESRNLSPRFFSVRSSDSGLSLVPVAKELLGQMPRILRGWALAV